MPSALLRYEVSGTGFLRHMVRTMAGTLAEIGLGRRPIDDIPAMLAARQRAAAGRTAPPHGLVLGGRSINDLRGPPSAARSREARPEGFSNAMWS